MAFDQPTGRFEVTMDTTNCPVCGMPVEITAETPKSSYDGETYYFCSEACKQSFDREPAKYLVSS
jgi:YHS domain-containing protein